MIAFPKSLHLAASVPITFQANNSMGYLESQLELYLTQVSRITVLMTYMICSLPLCYLHTLLSAQISVQIAEW